MTKVLIADKMSAAARRVFEARGIEVDVRTGLDPAALAAAMNGYEGLAVRSATKVTAALLDEAGALRVVGRAGIGIDNIDVEAATAHGVVVMNTPHGNAITTAEHTIALLFALARQIPAADRSTQAGKWEKARFMGVELTGKTLGIIGNLGTTLGDAGVNIATFNLGRSEPGGDAVALIEVDEALSAEVLAKVAALPDIVQVKALQF